MSTIEDARANLDEAITEYARVAGNGNEVVTAWLVISAAVASDLGDGETAVLVTCPEHQPFLTNLGMATYVSRYFGTGDDE